MKLSREAQGIGVYIHVPYCVSKCLYCDFYSFAIEGNDTAEFTNKIAEEIEKTTFPYPINTVFIGGGTPTVLQTEQIKRIIGSIYQFPLTDDIEISIEANPGTVNKNSLRELKNMGINRISFGLQSTHNRLLKALGRRHSYEEFEKNYFAAREAGFDNINVDLMYALPNQSPPEWDETVEKIISLAPEHVSTYSLTPAPGTPLWDAIELWQNVLPDEETDREMYYNAIKKLTGAGYKHYEISNFAKPGYECRHNVNCWTMQPYLGFGDGAFSFDGVQRWGMQENEPLSQADLMSEAMILGLRMLDGVSIPDFESKFGISPMKQFQEQLIVLEKKQLITISDTIKLSRQGLDLSNIVFTEFI